MPTIDEWINALIADYEIRVISSDELINDVKAKQAARIQECKKKNIQIPKMKTNLKPLNVFNPQVTILVKPLSILHSIGVVTTPAIHNLVDICSTWAVIRYIWAFDISTAARIEPLKLSRDAREIGFHQKSLLSEEVGVGIVKYLMENYLGVPNSIDVDLALKTPSWNIDRQLTTIPDYLFYDNPIGNVYVVECKGNQTSRSSTLDQLRRGTEQVPSIKFNSGHQAVSLIIGTCLLKDCTEVYVIDPPDNKERNGKYLDLSSNTRDDSTWEVIDSEKFKNDIQAFNRAKMLTFAGAEWEALSQIPVDLPSYKKHYIKQNLQKLIIENEFGDFQGIRFTLPTQDGVTVEVFRGLLRDVMDLYIEGNEEKASEKLDDLRNKLKTKKGVFNTERQHNVSKAENDYATELNSVGLDGTILQIKLSS